MVGAGLFHVGSLEAARVRFDQGVALYDRRRHRYHAFVYGHDPGVSCLSYLAETMWLLGYPDQALERADELLALARELSQPFGLAYAQVFGGARVRLYRGEVAAAHEIIQSAIALSTQYGFRMWESIATANLGWVLVAHGALRRGVRNLRDGLATMQATGCAMWRPYYLALLGPAHAAVGQAETGLEALARALAQIERTGEITHLAEVHRLHGETLLRSDVSEAEAEDCFDCALAVARQEGARSLELRAAMSMGRLWAKQGKREQARELVQGVYGWFTEGFDTADLRAARALLGGLAREVS
jgi:predicted ATPase